MRCGEREAEPLQARARPCVLSSLQLTCESALRSLKKLVHGILLPRRLELEPFFFSLAWTFDEAILAAYRGLVILKTPYKCCFLVRLTGEGRCLLVLVSHNRFSHQWAPPQTPQR
jgi:hypothetical protein